MNMKHSACCLVALSILYLITPASLAGSAGTELQKKLGISVTTTGSADWLEYTVTIPKDSREKNGVGDVIFVLCADGDLERVQVRVPVAVTQGNSGERIARLCIGKEHMANAFIEVTYCPGPKAPLMFMVAPLADFTGTDKEKTRSQQPVRGDGQPAPQP